jgi:hypothetical protein
MNNLDPAVAQYPEELVTYGGNGQVFSNWAQVDFLRLDNIISFYFMNTKLSQVLDNNEFS